MSTNENLDGPDGLQRLHKMLTDTYGLEIPSDDYYAVVILLDALGASLRGIVELMGRFTRISRGQLINDINGLVGGEIAVAETEVSRVKHLLVVHGYDEILSEASPKWISGVTDLDPLDQSIPTELRRYWTSLLQVFPKGLQTPKDYVTVLAVLRDEQLSSTEIEVLVSALINRPRELIARDVDRLGSMLIATEED